MKNMEINEQLRIFYQKCGYGPGELFSCKKNDCPARGNENIRHGVEAYVGEEYQETRLHVVFLCSDIGRNECRTIESRCSVIKVKIIEENDVKSHMKGTIETLGIILQKIDKVDDMKSFCKCRNNRELVKKCAIVNTVKCSREGKMAELKEASSHCIKQYSDTLIKELSLLQPDIVVVQGNTAWRFFQKFCEGYDSNSWPTFGVANLNEKRIKFVAGYHPSARGKYAWCRQRQSILDAFKELKKLIDT